MNEEYDIEEINAFNKAVENAENAIDSLLGNLIIKSESDLYVRSDQCETIVKSIINWGRENLK